MSDDTTMPPTGGSRAERLVRAARAAQQLCDVLWESLHQELREDASAERIKELSERLATVSSTVAIIAAAAREAPSRERRSPPEPPTSFERPASSEMPPVPRYPSEPESPVALQPIPTRADGYMFTRLVDEHDSVDSAESLAPVKPQAPDAPADSHGATELEQSQIEIRDVRREEGPSAWVSSVGRLLARHAQDGLPFAVLLIEIVDVAQLERSETPHDMHGLVAQVESGLGKGMRSSDELARETLGRYWLVAPETNGTGARMLAERLARLVRTSASHRGVPLEVAIGIAVCPEDGTEAPALAARADLGVYSARATGRSIAHTEPPRG